MKLQELFEKKPEVDIPEFRYWERKPNQDGIDGARLAYIAPTMKRLDRIIDDAATKGDKGRKDRVALRKRNYKAQGQDCFPDSPDLGWWTSKTAYENEEGSTTGFTKGNIYQHYPDFRIFPSREEAEKAAKEKGRM